MTGCVGGRDGETIGARGLLEARASVIPRGDAHRRRSRLALAVEGFKIAQRYALDVAADTAFAEAQDHPRLETSDDARRDRWMQCQVIVETIGPGLHQLFEHDRRVGIARLEIDWIDEQFLTQVAVDRALALGLGQAPQSVQVVGLDALEIVLGLRVDQAEYRFGISGGADVGDSPI